MQKLALPCLISDQILNPDQARPDNTLVYESVTSQFLCFFVSCVKFLKCPTLISYQGNPGALGPRGDVGLPGTDVSYISRHISKLDKRIDNIMYYIYDLCL